MSDTRMDKTVVVPMEPPQMNTDGDWLMPIRDEFNGSVCDWAKIDDIYRGIIAAAPAPAAQYEREFRELPAILREAAAILSNERPMRQPIADELDGFAHMLEARAALTAPQDAQERNAIIEECAKVADAWKEESVAEAIRALKTAQPADKPLFDKAKIEQMMTTAKGKGMDLG